jgi:hypothetical protein
MACTAVPQYGHPTYTINIPSSVADITIPKPFDPKIYMPALKRPAFATLPRNRKRMTTEEVKQRLDYAREVQATDKLISTSSRGTRHVSERVKATVESIGRKCEKVLSVGINKEQTESIIADIVIQEVFANLCKCERC